LTEPATGTRLPPVEAWKNGLRMPAWLYDAGPHAGWLFVLVTLLLGGSAAFVSGRAMAITWRPRWQIPIYMLMLAAAVRFIQYAVFGARLVAVPAYIVDFVALLVISLAAYALTRNRQMARQYGWEHGRAGP